MLLRFRFYYQWTDRTGALSIGHEWAATVAGAAAQRRRRCWQAGDRLGPIDPVPDACMRPDGSIDLIARPI